jgi:hypothetical protein
MRCADGTHDHHSGLSITRSVNLGFVTSPLGSGRSLPSGSGRSLASGDRGLLRLLTFAGSHPLITDGHSLMPEQIVSGLLDGVLVRSADPAEITPGDEPC